MRVIQLPREETEIVTECRCGTRFAFWPKEGEFVSDPRDGNCLKIACPHCKRDHFVAIRQSELFGK
jgi:hypothetical protein